MIRLKKRRQLKPRKNRFRLFLVRALEKDMVTMTLLVELIPKELVVVLHHFPSAEGVAFLPSLQLYSAYFALSDII